MAKPKVFVTRRIPEAGLSKVLEHTDAEVWADRLPPPPEVLAEKILHVDGLISLLTDAITPELMDRAKNLKVISNYAVGFNNINIPAATERGIAVGNTPGVLTDATADMAFCLLIAAARRLVEGHRDAAAGDWLTWEPLGHIGQDLVGATVGIIGMGRIGYAMAKRCHGGFGMKVLYHDRYRNEAAENDLGARQVELAELLAESDFISIHTDLNPETHGMFGRDTFAQMKPTSVLINTARGPIVDNDALATALEEGQIFAAGLDVTDPEPLLSDHALYRQDRAIIAPHIASATVNTRDGMAEICADNLILGVSGQPLRCPVNPEVEGHRRA